MELLKYRKLLDLLSPYADKEIKRGCIMMEGRRYFYSDFFEEDNQYNSSYQESMQENVDTVGYTFIDNIFYKKDYFNSVEGIYINNMNTYDVYNFFINNRLYEIIEEQIQNNELDYNKALDLVLEEVGRNSFKNTLDYLLSKDITFSKIVGNIKIQNIKEYIYHIKYNIEEKEAAVEHHIHHKREALIKVIGHIGITTVLKYLDVVLGDKVLDITTCGCMFEGGENKIRINILEKPGTVKPYFIPNKELHLYTKQELEELYNLLFYLKE